MMTGSSSDYQSTQFILLTTKGLYAWGDAGGIFSGGSTAELNFQQVPLPPGIFPEDVKMMDAGNGIHNADSEGGARSLVLLTQTGDVWIYVTRYWNSIYPYIAGDGKAEAINSLPTSQRQAEINKSSLRKWFRVMKEDGSPLTGMLDVRTAGRVAIATDGTDVYTWGERVFLGNNTQMQDIDLATKMTLPAGIGDIKQQDLNNFFAGSSNNIRGTSYYVRDSNGKLFVLGANYYGQLGLGNTQTALEWEQVEYVYEEPQDSGNQTDVQKPIGYVTWISANNQDIHNPAIAVIADKRIYTAGYDGGGTSFGKRGVVNNNTNYALTAVTDNDGANILEGDMKFVEMGSRISYAVKEGSKVLGFAGAKFDGNWGCPTCSFSSNDRYVYEYEFPDYEIGVICGNTPSVPDYPYDFGDVPESYEHNLNGDGVFVPARQEISDELLIGEIVDGEAGPQSVAPGANNNGTNGDGEDEDGITNLPVLPSSPGSEYTVNVKVKNTTTSTATLHGWIDFNGDGIFGSEEHVSYTIPADAGEDYEAHLTWPITTPYTVYTGSGDKTYMRLRLTDAIELEPSSGGSFYDDADTWVDERAIGDGMVNGQYGTAASLGEIEDYQLTVDPCLAGDVPPLAKEGVDVIFLLDNSGSVNKNSGHDEWEAMTASTQAIMNDVMAANPNNRAAVVHYATIKESSREGGYSQSGIWIESDFTNDPTQLAIERRGGSEGPEGSQVFPMNTWAYTAEAVRQVGFALDGKANSGIVSPQKTLTPSEDNQLVVFIFTDGYREFSSPMIDMRAREEGKDDEYYIYNQFKSERGITFVVVGAAPKDGEKEGEELEDAENISAKSTGAAIASVGGTFVGDKGVNVNDPEGSEVLPRRFTFTVDFELSDEQVHDMSEAIVSASSAALPIPCRETTVNLNSLVENQQPGTSVVWFDGIDPLTANPVANPEMVQDEGAYYAFYYDAANLCYSPPSLVVVYKEECPVVITNPMLINQARR